MDELLKDLYKQPILALTWYLRSIDHAWRAARLHGQRFAAVQNTGTSACSKLTFFRKNLRTATKSIHSFFW